MAKNDTMANRNHNRKRLKRMREKVFDMYLRGMISEKEYKNGMNNIHKLIVKECRKEVLYYG